MLRLVKLIDLKEAKARLGEFVDAAQRDRILITRRGKPASLAATITSDEIRQSFGIETRSLYRRIQARSGWGRGAKRASIAL
jgi:antitoxin (DNA-binding transcriptional repressor) of toxin-antitoxin stability system